MAEGLTREGLPRPEMGSDPSVLTSIYEQDVNLALWQRENKLVLEEYAKAWISQYPKHTPRSVVAVDNSNNSIDDQLNAMLPELTYQSEFKQELALLIDMFACLFDLSEVGVRLAPLTQAMCPKFHVDNIPCRLVTTYGGVGTEWLMEKDVNRNFLGIKSNGLLDTESGVICGDKIIQQVDSQQTVLLKGSGWIGNDEYGLVHRSPNLSDGQSRLLLTLDLF